MQVLRAIIVCRSNVRDAESRDGFWEIIQTRRVLAIALFVAPLIACDVPKDKAEWAATCSTSWCVCVCATGGSSAFLVL